jgi:hypothetical protein
MKQLKFVFNRAIVYMLTLALMNHLVYAGIKLLLNQVMFLSYWTSNSRCTRGPVVFYASLTSAV